MDEVHLHEVGALEAVADIVGVCTAVADLGVGRDLADRVAVGSGTVRTEHGVLPVAVPAVVDVLSTAGATMYAGPAEPELCISTGAALLATLGDGWGPVPPMRGKMAWEGRERVNEQPEYDDLVMGVEATGTPLKVVLARAVSALTENHGYTYHNSALAPPRPTENIPSGSEVP